MHRRLAPRLSTRAAPLAAVLAVSGCCATLAGGAWDASSHALDAPESFWTVQHLAVYAGVGSSVSAALVARAARSVPRAALLLLASGALLQAGSGAADSVSHELFGIDGLVSFSHQPLELGLALSSAGAVSMLRGGPLLLAIPASLALVASSAWLAFNLMLLPAATILCAPVYVAFSSGCAVM